MSNNIINYPIYKMLGEKPQKEIDNNLLYSPVVEDYYYEVGEFLIDGGKYRIESEDENLVSLLTKELESHPQKNLSLSVGYSNEKTFVDVEEDIPLTHQLFPFALREFLEGFGYTISFAYFNLHLQKMGVK